MSRLLVLMIVVLVILVFLLQHQSVSTTFEIFQMSIDKLTPDYLFEKKPILITDRIVDPISLLTTAFKFTYLFKSFASQDQLQVENVVNSQYALITSRDAKSRIVIDHPLPQKFETNLEIPLERYQVLILPWKWKFVVVDGSVDIIRLHTLASVLARK